MGQCQHSFVLVNLWTVNFLSVSYLNKLGGVIMYSAGFNIGIEACLEAVGTVWATSSQMLLAWQSTGFSQDTVDISKTWPLKGFVENWENSNNFVSDITINVALCL